MGATFLKMKTMFFQAACKLHVAKMLVFVLLATLAMADLPRDPNTVQRLRRRLGKKKGNGAKTAPNRYDSVAPLLNELKSKKNQKENGHTHKKAQRLLRLWRPNI